MLKRIIVFLVIYSLCIVSQAFARKLEVGPDKQYPTIQSAIDAAADGDKIYIDPGAYQESIVLRKRIEIIGVGEDPSLCVVEGEGLLLRITGVQKGEIKNITFRSQGSGGSGTSPMAHISNAGKKFQIRDCVFDGASLGQIGILLDDRSIPMMVNIRTQSFVHTGWEVIDYAKPEALNCSFYGIGLISISFSDNSGGNLKHCQFNSSSGGGINVGDQAHLLITDSVINDQKYALQVDGNATLVVDNTIIIATRQSSTISGRAKVQITHSTLLDNSAGALTIKDRAALTMQLATFRNNKGYGLKGEGNATLMLTDVFLEGDADIGLVISEDASLTARQCQFSGLSQGIVLQTGAKIKQSISSSVFAHCRRGIVFNGETLAAVSFSEFIGCNIGIRASDSVSVTLSETTFSSSAQFALTLQDKVKMMVKKCVFRDSQSGILMDDDTLLRSTESLWTNLLQVVGEIQGNATFLATGDSFENLQQGIVLKESSVGQFSSCQAKVIENSWVKAEGNVHVSVNNSAIKKSGRGFDIKGNASLISNSNTFSECQKAAVYVSEKADLYSEEDIFKSNGIAIVSDLDSKSGGVEVKKPTFSKQESKTLSISGAGVVIVEGAIFNGERTPVEISGSASATLRKPVFDGLEPGGVVTYGQSRLTIADTSFKGFKKSFFSVTQASYLTFENILFSDGEGTVIDAKGKASVEFVDCELRDIGGDAIEAKDEVTIMVTRSNLIDLETPIKIGVNTTIHLSDVVIRGTKEGIRLLGRANLDIRGLRIIGSNPQALYLDSTGTIEIHDVVIDSGDVGIVSLGRSKPVFSGLKITAPNVGLKLTDTTQCQINDLKIEKSEIGLLLQAKALLSLQRGEVTDVVHAIVAKDDAQATIKGITVKKSQYGVVLGNDTRVALSDSDITAVANGITVRDKATFEGGETVVRVEHTGLDLQGHANADLKNLKIVLTSSKGIGVIASGSPDGVVDGLQVNGGKLGLQISESLPLVFKNIQFSNNKEAGLLFEGKASTHIIGGTIEGNNKGAVIGGEAQPAITGVTCVKCETGFIVTENARPSLDQCGVQGGKNGILVEKNSKPNISRFHAKDGTGFGNGVMYRDGAGGILKEPQIGGVYQYGIVLYDNANPFIVGTTEVGHVRDCGNGIGIMGYGNPVIYSILIEENAQNGIVLEGNGKPDQLANAYISGCRIRSHMNGAGIYVGKNSKAYVLGLFRNDVTVPPITTYYQNIIRSNLTGIMAVENGAIMVDGNMIENNGVGIEVTQKSSASIHRNHIRESKFIVMDKGGVGIIVRDKARISISDHNRLYKNRAAGILVTSAADKILIKNNEIYENVNLPFGSNLNVNTMGAVMVKGDVNLDFHSNYLYDNKSAGVIVLSAANADFKNNLFERNQRAALQLDHCENFVVENNTFIGTKNNDVGLLLGGSMTYGNGKKFSFQNNLLSKFSKAFDASERITSINKKWIIRRNSIHNCELENGPNLPDLLKNYKIDPVFADPNGRGMSAFTPEPGSNVCDNSKIYDWGEARYCGAVQCRDESGQKEDVRLAILSPQKDGDIVPRKLSFKAQVVIPEEKDVASWELYVNGNLVKQSRGISIVKHEEDSGTGAAIETSISSLPYGKSLIRLEVNSSKGEQWTADRTVYTASCSETHKRWVVLVGVSDYDDTGGVPDLAYAASDALALGKILNRRSLYSPFQDVEVITLVDEQATREGLREALFGKIAPCVRADDEVIIFFAGHGAVEKDRFYLVLHDSDLNRLELTGYEMQELRDVIRYNIKSDNIMLLFDACHSGGVSLERAPANVLNTHLSDLTTTMENLNIITASQGNEVSYEFPDCCLNKAEGKCADDISFSNDGHGAFTCTLLHAMTGYKVEEGKNQMTFEDIAQFVEEWLPKQTEQQQHPQVLSNSSKTMSVTSIPGL